MRCVNGKKPNDPEGRWRVRVSLGRDPVTGNPKQAERTMTGTRADAEAMLAKMHLDPRLKARKSTGPKMTVTEALDAYIAHLEYLGREQTTLATYRAQAKVFQGRIGDRRLASIEPHDLDAVYAWLMEKGRTSMTLRRYHFLLSGMFGYAMRSRWIEIDPTDRITLPKVQRYRPVTQSVELVLKTVDAVAETNPILGLGLWLAIATGCRRGEVCALRYGDVGDDGRLHVSRSVAEVGGKIYVKDTKTHADRVVMLDPGTVERIALSRAVHERWAAEVGCELVDDPFVMADPMDPRGGVPMRPERLSRAWQAGAERTGCPGRLHDLRHLQASLLLAEGLPVKDVADRLGHASATTTMNIYAHVLAGRDQMAADIIGAKLRRS